MLCFVIYVKQYIFWDTRQISEEYSDNDSNQTTLSWHDQVNSLHTHNSSMQLLSCLNFDLRPPVLYYSFISFVLYRTCLLSNLFILANYTIVISLHHLVQTPKIFFFGLNWTCLAYPVPSSHALLFFYKCTWSLYTTISNPSPGYHFSTAILATPHAHFSFLSQGHFNTEYNTNTLTILSSALSEIIF